MVEINRTKQAMEKYCAGKREFHKFISTIMNLEYWLQSTQIDAQKNKHSCSKQGCSKPSCFIAEKCISLCR